jgi:hypothetical protein
MASLNAHLCLSFEIKFYLNIFSSVIAIKVISTFRMIWKLIMDLTLYLITPKNKFTLNICFRIFCPKNISSNNIPPTPN